MCLYVFIILFFINYNVYKKKIKKNVSKEEPTMYIYSRETVKWSYSDQKNN